LSICKEKYASQRKQAQRICAMKNLPIHPAASEAGDFSVILVKNSEKLYPIIHPFLVEN